MHTFRDQIYVASAPGPANAACTSTILNGLINERAGWSYVSQAYIRDNGDRDGYVTWRWKDKVMEVYFALYRRRPDCSLQERREQVQTFNDNYEGARLAYVNLLSALTEERK